MDKNQIGIKLKRLRIRGKYSKQEISAMCEITLNELLDIEKGNRYPNEQTLETLLELYQITEEDLQKRSFVDHEKIKYVINYVQTAIIGLAIFAYALPFTLHYYGPLETIVPDYPGYMLLFNYRFGYPYVVTIVFIVLIVELGLHILLLVKRKMYSNIYKIIFIMMNSISAILLYIDFQEQNNMTSTLVVFIVLFCTHIGITVFDIIKYPLNHDTKHDLQKMRRVFAFFITLTYFFMYCFVVIDLFRNPYPMTAFMVIFFVIALGYFVSYIFLSKQWLESRLNVSLYLAFPAVFFTITAAIDMYFYGEIEDFFYPLQILMFLLMFLPVIIVNIDYFISMIRESIHRGDTETKENQTPVK